MATATVKESWERVWARIGPKRRAMKGRLFQAQGGCCAYCGARTPFQLLTFDHVMPLRYGGPDVYENLLLACEPCNHQKAGSLPTLEFHEAIRLRIHNGVRAA